METLVGVVAGIIVILSLVLLGGPIVVGALKRLRADRRAGELLRTVLTQEQYCQLTQRGYVDIPSPTDSQRVYRVPKNCGRVHVRDRGRVTMWLCLQPLEQVPDADLVVIHKLMIEADEQTYLQKANVTVPLYM